MAGGGGGGTKKRVRYAPHYITGLGDGNAHHETDSSSPKNPALRVARQNNNNINNNNNKHGVGDEFDEKNVRKTLHEMHHGHHRINVRTGTGSTSNTDLNESYGQQKAAASSTKVKSVTGSAWDWYFFQEPGGNGANEYGGVMDGTAAAPWQMSAFALLGAVILLSALFLHVLADAPPDHNNQQNNNHHHHHNGHHYYRPRPQRRRQSKATKRKKTDEWSDDAAEDELLSASLRGYRADHPADADDSHHAPSHQAAHIFYPYQQPPKLQHRKNTTSGGVGTMVSNSGAAAAAAGAASGGATANAAPFQHRNYYINQSGGAVVATTSPTKRVVSRRGGGAAAAAAAAAASEGGINNSTHSSTQSVASSSNQSTSTSSCYQNRTPSALKSTVQMGSDAAGPPAHPSLPQQEHFYIRRSPQAAAYDNSSRRNLNARVLSSVSSFGSLGGPAVVPEEEVITNNNSSSNSSKIELKSSPKNSVSIQVPSSAQQQQQQQQSEPSCGSGDVENNGCTVLRNHVFQTSPDEGGKEAIKLSDLVERRTPRVRNGRLTVGEATGLTLNKDKNNERQQQVNDQDGNNDKAAAAVSLTPSKNTTTSATITTTPKAPAKLGLEVSSPAAPIMPFLPNLDPENDHHLISKPPRSINVDDLHLYMLMESGNVTWQQAGVSASPSEDSGILAPTPPPGLPPAPLLAPELPLQPSISECTSSDYYIDDDASLDDNDPRKNIRHKRGKLTNDTNAAQSLQGEINFSDLQMEEVIGGGGFGQVWRAVWVGTPVAVKVLTGSAQSKNVPRAVMEEFAAEINLLRGMRHPNICLYMGACLRPPNRAIITELAANGSLWDALRLPLTPPYSCCDGISSQDSWPVELYRPDPRHGAPPAMSSRSSPPVPPRGTWPWVLVKRVACGAARGMAYLHSGSPPVLHRDLKSANILLDESYTAKVCDFGLSRLKSQDRSMTGNCGTVQWMAPEVLANQSYNEKADVFSYGIICWELLTRQCPYEGMSAIQCAMAVLNRNQRPEIPRFCPPPLQALIRKCIKKDPKERPTFAQILEALDEMP